MKRTTYYLIRPKQTLLTVLSNYSDDIRLLMSQSEMWAKTETDGLWLPQQHILQVKLIFLADLQQKYQQDADMNTLLKGICGSIAPSVDTFDHWWTLERYSSVEHFEEIVSSLNKSHVDLPTGTGDPLIDRWFLSEFGGSAT